ncbi:MAG: UDP-N-acetylmuramoyl-tripeptide--D-alanyl-D-alanine ligase, partial [Clostridia bacterium]|nr:UDP-N-acetylmuramoyl-tripeptide--D-alanyl-D-alanine ligase [Clostridia bacterium]
SGRMAVEKLDRFTLLNDVYNANPTSMEASLQVLSRANGRKVCILGDMLELGEQAAALHERVAREATRLGINVILGVGPLFEPAVQAAGGLGFATQEQLLAVLPDLLQDDDTILVKGSRGMHLENTAAYIRSL